MYLDVIDVKPLENYILLLTFENGEKRKFDVKPYFSKGIFTELKNEDVFKSVKVAFGTVEWCNKADIDPEELYKESILVE